LHRPACWGAKDNIGTCLRDGRGRIITFPIHHNDFGVGCDSAKVAEKIGHKWGLIQHRHNN
jgi:hypothetical protein